MKNTGIVRIVSVLLLLSSTPFLATCGGSPKVTTNGPESEGADVPEIEMITHQTFDKRLVRTDPVSLPNCDGPTTKTKPFEVSFQSTEGTKIGISSELGVDVAALRAKIGADLEKRYGTTKAEKSSVLLETPPGYDFTFQVEYYETWAQGEVMATVGQEKLPSIPYTYPVSYGVEIGSREEYACPPPEASFSVASETSGTAAFNVQFIDESTGYVIEWSWDFGDGETSQAQNPVHSYARSSYNYSTGKACHEPGSYTVRLTVWTNQTSATKIIEDLITVKPEEHTITLQPEPYALKEYVKLLHNPGCSQTCGMDLGGRTISGACLTETPSKPTDEAGHYFHGQQIGLQVSHRVRYCPTGVSSDPLAGVWVFDRWSVDFANQQQLSQPAGDHLAIVDVEQDLYVQAIYKKEGPCQ